MMWMQRPANFAVNLFDPLTFLVTVCSFWIFSRKQNLGPAGRELFSTCVLFPQFVVCNGSGMLDRTACSKYPRNWTGKKLSYVLFGTLARKESTSMSEKKVRVSKLILEVVEKQLASGKPAQTKETLDRLISEGFSEENAKHLIGSVMVVEMHAVVSEGRPFKEERYLSMLQNLPLLP